MGFVAELKRRNVFRVGVAYAVSAWLVLQVVDLLVEHIETPDWVMDVLFLGVVIGFFVALVVAWVYEVTPEGIKREKDVDRSQSITPQTGRKLNRLIIGVLVIAVGVLLADKFLLRTPDPAPTQAPVVEVADTNSVAVLPFVDMSPAKDQEYFTDGLTENLLHALAQIQELKVAGRTSSFAFKGKNTDLREIGEQLNVSNILEGSVQKAGDRVRITTQLINAEDGYHLWSETFDRDLNDIFVVQDEIAAAVARALRKSLLGEATHSTATTEDFEAYNAYLLGLSYFNKRTTEDWDRAIEQFQLAVENDPNMALGWAGLSQAYSVKTAFGSGFAEGFARARAAADKALELDPNLADAHLALSEVQTTFDWDWDGAAASLQRASELRPGDPDIIAKTSRLKRIRGEELDAFEDIEEALSHDPLNFDLKRTRIGMLGQLGRWDEALSEAKLLARTSPESGGVNYALARTHYRRGELELSLAAAEKEVFDFLRLEHEAILYNQLDDQETARQKLDELVAAYGDDVSWQVARVYSAWGDKDQTIAALERGIAIRDPGLVYLKTAREINELLGDDPRLADLLERMNLL